MSLGLDNYPFEVSKVFLIFNIQCILIKSGITYYMFGQLCQHVK